MTPIEMLFYRIAELERRLNNCIRDGRITDIDAKKGVRAAIADGPDGVVKTPWIKPMESGGVLTTWTPMKEGQSVKIHSPNGEIGANSVIAPYHHNDAHPAPSNDLDAAILKSGDAQLHFKGGVLTLKAKEIVIEGDKITMRGEVKISGAALRHNDKDIGSTHRHKGVQSGSGVSDAPI